MSCYCSDLVDWIMLLLLLIVVGAANVIVRHEPVCLTVDSRLVMITSSFTVIQQRQPYEPSLHLPAASQHGTGDSPVQSVLPTRCPDIS